MEEQLKQLDTAKALLIGLFIAGFYYLTLYDSGEMLDGQISNNQSALAAKQKELKTMEKTLVDAEKHREVSRRLGEQMDAVLRAVPEEYNSLELMKVLSDEAKVVGTSIVSLKPIDGRRQNRNRSNDKKAESPFRPVTVEVNLSGTFNQLMLFMSNLTKVSKVILVKQLTLSLDQPNKVFEVSSPIVKFTATFEAYRYAPDEGGK